jgi:hypothetical protein
MSVPTFDPEDYGIENDAMQMLAPAQRTEDHVPIAFKAQSRTQPDSLLCL